MRILERITNGVYGIASYDDNWHCFINCYVIRDEFDVILVDTLDRGHNVDLLDCLNELNITDGVNTIIFTHGHKDHTGNAAFFDNAKKYLHPMDFPLADQACLSIEDLPYENIETIHIGIHTPGSSALYLKNKKILFIGDELEFGRIPVQNKLICGEKELKQQIIADPNTVNYLKFLKDRNVYVNKLISSLIDIAKYDIEYLCTGHGVVLKCDIPDFLMKVARKYEYLMEKI